MDRITNNISDVRLQEIAFNVHLKRVALLLKSTNINYHEQVMYAVEVLHSLLLRSNLTLRQTFAKYIAAQPHLITFTLETLQSCLESYSKFLIH